MPSSRDRDAARDLLDARLGLVVQLLGQPHQAVGEREHGVVVAVADGHALQQVLERHAGLLLQRAAFGLERLLHAHGVDQHEAGLGAVGAVADALEAVAIEAAHAAALHLLVVALAAHVAHEEQHFQRLHVGAGGDHVHGDGDARVVVVAEAGEDAVGVFFGLVGDLLAEGVALAIDLAHDVDDVVGVAVGLGEDQGLGRFLAGGEDLRLHGGLHGLDHLADLAGVDDGAIQFLAGVGGVFLGLGPALLAGLAVAVVDPFLGLELGALLGDLGFDLVDVIADVDAIGHRLLVGVFGDDVLVEEAEGALVGRGGEADQEGIEVVEHLLPEVVDAAVALVDDDEVEGLDRHGRVVADQLVLLGGLLHFVERDVLGRFVDRLAGEDRIHALDGADAHLRMRVDGGRGQALDVVELGELARVVRRRVGHELLMRLFAQVAGIDQEQDALGAAKFEQAIDRGDRGRGVDG